MNFPIYTHSGEMIDRIDRAINPRQLNIWDIAWGLSNICRFSGQCAFYTVGGHSILVSQWIEKHGGTPQEALWGLLHDASEAYIQDIPMPIKCKLPLYYKYEARFMKAICDRFGLPRKQPAIVHTADMAMLEIEKIDLFCEKLLPWINKHPYQAFLDRFYELGGQHHNVQSEPARGHSKRSSKVRRGKGTP